MQTLAWVVGLAFLPVGLAAYTCAGGVAPSANGCCSDNKCPECCLEKRQSSATDFSSSDDPIVTHKCACKGCHGDAIVDDAKCTSDCKGFLTDRSDNMSVSMSMMGCAMCYGEKTFCLNPVATCAPLLEMSPGGPTIVAGKVNCPTTTSETSDSASGVSPTTSETSDSASGVSTAVYRIASIGALVWMISSKA